MKIDPAFVTAIRNAKSVADLQKLVQKAIELEHATIPPYLCGYFTLKLGTNEAVGDIIRSVVIEKMLHFTIASNLLIAIGGTPQINAKGFVPTYPGDLPFGIGDQPGHEFDVRLRKCSLDQVENTFQKIEEPEYLIEIPVVTANLALAAHEDPKPEFDTIGAFYAFLKHKILAMKDQIDWQTQGQVVATKWFWSPKEMFLIDGPDVAARAIDVIVDQGEGTSQDPFDMDDVPAHYYRFGEIVAGRKLIRKPGAKPPYAYGGDPVAFDPAGVWDMDDDPSIAKYRPGSASHQAAVTFSYAYTRALNALHTAFNGGGETQIDHAMGVMYELRLLAQQVLATPAEYADGSPNPDGKATGLSFERVEVTS